MGGFKFASSSSLPVNPNPPHQQPQIENIIISVLLPSDGPSRMLPEVIATLAKYSAVAKESENLLDQ